MLGYSGMSDRPRDLELELREVVIALKDVAGKQWYDLGLQLRLPPSILDSIASHPDAEDHKRMMLRRWLQYDPCLLYTSPSPRDATLSRMPSSA